MSAQVLDRRALVLNTGWTAIATVPVRSALQLLVRGAARVVRPETDETHDFHSWADLAVAPSAPCIRSIRLSIRVPEVIVLTGFNGFPRGSVTFSRRQLYRRDHFTCQYCGARPGSPELSIDHIVPRSRGGKATWVNCVLACVRCNRRKADRTPQEAGLTLRSRPVEPRWTPTLEIPISTRCVSWQRYLSERYWDTPLEP